MTSPESRDHETRRIEHPTPEEIEEIDSKRNYMKIIEELKQEVKNKKVDKMNKSLKDTQEKAIKQVMETVQDLKNEMEVMKKTQTKEWMDMESLGEV